MDYSRVYLLVLDGLGVGSAPDAAEYGDDRSDTLLHISKQARLMLANLARLGLGNLYPLALDGVPSAEKPLAHHARLTEVSAGKDTTTGHWELTGAVREKPAPTFPNGFPQEFLDGLGSRIQRKFIGNKPASGTEIIKDLGPEHCESGDLIVYTSADSVFQVAAHEEVVSTDELYFFCMLARKLLVGDLAVDRVIARPFTGNPVDGYERTEDRKDFALPPPGPTVLDGLKQAGKDVIGVGKISDIFAGQGLTASYAVHGNESLMDSVEEFQEDDSWEGLVFCNLVDFDMLYGHRNNVKGYAKALNEFDWWLGNFIKSLQDNELLIITADHGNDPTTPSTDHSREQVPLLIYSNAIASAGGKLLTPPPGFMHVSATIAAALGVKTKLPGENLLG